MANSGMKSSFTVTHTLQSSQSQYSVLNKIPPHIKRMTIFDSIAQSLTNERKIRTKRILNNMSFCDSKKASALDEIVYINYGFSLFSAVFFHSFAI